MFVKILWTISILLLVACDRGMYIGIESIPDAFEVEETYYFDGRFPSCYGSGSRVTQESTNHFKRNSDDFKEVSNPDVNVVFTDWQPTPVPRVILDGSSIKTRTYDAVVICGNEKDSDKAGRYKAIFSRLARTGGALYSFSDGDESFILFNPESRLLFHAIHD